MQSILLPTQHDSHFLLTKNSAVLFSSRETDSTLRGEPCRVKSSHFILLDSEISDKIDWEALGEDFLPDKINTHTHMHTNTWEDCHLSLLPAFEFGCVRMRSLVLLHRGKETSPTSWCQRRNVERDWLLDDTAELLNQPGTSSLLTYGRVRS